MVTLDDIRSAQARIAGVARHTPLIAYTPQDADRALWLKPEQLQPIGSFKIRGAYNRIAAIPPETRAHGVIAYSSGNHAQGVAFAAQRLNIPAVIVMPANAPQVKIDATRAYGVEVVLYDPLTQSREEVARDLMEGKNWTLIPSFNDPLVIAGQGTVGLEIAQDLPDVELVLVPVGGGGLISGIAAALKSLNPPVKVIGVEPALAADAQASLRSGQIVQISGAEANRTIADGVRTLAVGALTLEHLLHYVDDIVTVSEDEIRSAARQLIIDAKLVTEPSAALGFAAYRFHRDLLPTTRNVVIVLTGGSIDPALLVDLLR